MQNFNKNQPNTLWAAGLLGLLLMLAGVEIIQLAWNETTQVTGLPTLTFTETISFFFLYHLVKSFFNRK